jgi:hypothetical protein
MRLIDCIKLGIGLYIGQTAAKYAHEFITERYKVIKK